MNLDDLQTQWTEHDRKLDHLVQLNHKVLNADRLEKARSALRRQRRWAIFGIVSNAIVIPFVGLFIALNHALLRYLLPAIAIDLYFIGNLVIHAIQAHLLSGLDYVGPVIVIQRRIDEIVRLRIRFAQWLAMTMILLWVPISVVGAKQLFGLDLYAIAPRWLLANAAAGVCCIPIVLLVAARVARGKMARPAQHFLREVTGENLSVATTFLSALSELEQDRVHRT
ncbi:MAG TPA: hypothetical protein VHY19_04725 [Steroidobacteraceae bacterium]|jgi:hypothetical protein|nr:hypothetical protein [Steroidobacteraceae bacterium]